MPSSVSAGLILQRARSLGRQGDPCARLFGIARFFDGECFDRGCFDGECFEDDCVEDAWVVEGAAPRQTASDTPGTRDHCHDSLIIGCVM
jgi:hypothetical protein